MRPELVFPDAARRALYTYQPPWTERGLRACSFSLEPQPGMVESRHFHVVGVTFAPAGTFVQDAGAEPALSGTGGPNGGFVDLSARTRDGAYDVRVFEGSLLPVSVPPPEFPLEPTLQALLRRYDEQRGRAP